MEKTQTIGNHMDLKALKLAVANLGECEEYLSDDQLALFEKHLLSEQVTVPVRQEELKKSIAAMETKFSDPADKAQADIEQAEYESTIAANDVHIRGVIRALKDIKNGDFGYCAYPTCGNDIGVNRLLFRPTVTQCVDCAQEEESKAGRIRNIKVA